MSHVAWLSRPTGHNAITVVAADIYPRVFVSLGASHWRVTAAMHFVPELKRSMPHLETGCQFCRYPATVKSWFPAQICPISFNRSCMSEPILKTVPKRLPEFSSWLPKVCEIPPSAAALLDKIKPGVVFAICRGEGRFSKKVLFKVYDQLLENILPPFDVRPFLEKTWGLVDFGQMAGK